MVGGWPFFGRAVSFFFSLSFRSDDNIGEFAGDGVKRDLDPCCILRRKHGASGAPAPSMLPSMPGNYSISTTSAPACGETLLGAKRSEQRGLPSCRSVPPSPPADVPPHVPVFRPALAPSFRKRTSVSGTLSLPVLGATPISIERKGRGGVETGQRAAERNTPRGEKKKQQHVSFDRSPSS